MLTTLASNYLKNGKLLSRIWWLQTKFFFSLTNCDSKVAWVKLMTCTGIWQLFIFKLGVFSTHTYFLTQARSESGWNSKIFIKSPDDLHRELCCRFSDCKDSSVTLTGGLHPVTTLWSSITGATVGITHLQSDHKRCTIYYFYVSLHKTVFQTSGRRHRSWHCLAWPACVSTRSASWPLTNFVTDQSQLTNTSDLSWELPQES